ncbi:unnamed protein product [Ixodes pacificus]
MYHQSLAVEMTLLDAANKSYAEQHHLDLYLTEAVRSALLLRIPEDALNSFFFQFFQSVSRGEHTVGRGFAFVSGSVHNRRSAANTALAALGHLTTVSEPLSVSDWHALLQLLWPDIPEDIVLKSTSLAMAKERTSHSKVEARSFLRAFGVQLVFEDFLNVSEEIFKELGETRPDATIGKKEFLKRLEEWRQHLTTEHRQRSSWPERAVTDAIPEKLSCFSDVSNILLASHPDEQF